MDQFEKVVKGLECCLPETQEQAVLSCAACPYDPCRFSVSLSINLLDDVRKLITAQQERIKELEAGQTARVMTLEEVKDNEVMYLEDFTEPDDGVEPIIRPAVNVEAKNGGIVMLDSVAWDEGFIFVVDSEYGKTWRCWTQRPTDEQREAAAWTTD